MTTADDQGPLNEVFLRRRYVQDERSTVEIATELGVSAGTVARGLGRHGIPVRSHADRGRGTGSPLLRDPVWLRARYETDLLTLTQVGALAGVSGARVGQAMDGHGIARRPTGTVTPRPAVLDDRDWLVRHYQDDNMPVTRLARLAGCPRSAARDALLRHNIPLRPAPSRRH